MNSSSIFRNQIKNDDASFNLIKTVQKHLFLSAWLELESQTLINRKQISQNINIRNGHSNVISGHWTPKTGVLSPAEDLLQSSISSIYNNDSTLEALLFIAVIILGNVLSEELGGVVMEHGTGPVSWLLILSHFIWLFFRFLNDAATDSFSSSTKKRDIQV